MTGLLSLQVSVDKVLKTLKENVNKATSLLLTAIPQIGSMDWTETQLSLKVMHFDCLFCLIYGFLLLRKVYLRYFKIRKGEGRAAQKWNVIEKVCLLVHRFPNIHQFDIHNFNYPLFQPRSCS